MRETKTIRHITKSQPEYDYNANEVGKVEAFELKKNMLMVDCTICLLLTIKIKFQSTYHRKEKRRKGE